MPKRASGRRRSKVPVPLPFDPKVTLNFQGGSDDPGLCMCTTPHTHTPVFLFARTSVAGFYSHYQ